MSKNISSQQQAPQADRKPAPPKRQPAPVDPKEAERRREGGGCSPVLYPQAKADMDPRMTWRVSCDAKSFERFGFAD